jgi:hypothetical protein
MPKMPTWKPKALEDGGGVWEDERWSPIRLTIISGTEFEGRDLPVGGRFRSRQRQAQGHRNRARRLWLGRLHSEDDRPGQW